MAVSLSDLAATHQLRLRVQVADVTQFQDLGLERVNADGAVLNR